MSRRETRLDGMKEICLYFCRSESTILALIRDQGFPARKIGGSWASDKDLIDQWGRDLISGSIDLEAEIKLPNGEGDDNKIKDEQEAA